MDVFQHGGHVARGHAEGEPLDDRRLADARLAGQDRVVLATTDQDIHHLADLRLAPDNGVDLASLGPFGKVDRELVERRRLARRARRARRASLSRRGLARESRHLGVFRRSLNDRRQGGPERFGLHLGQLARGLADQARELVARKQRQQQHARPDGPRLELDRRREPRLAHQFVDRVRQHGRARINKVAHCRSPRSIPPARARGRPRSAGRSWPGRHPPPQRA